MSDFTRTIFTAVQTAVKNVYDVDVDEKMLVVETPKDPKMGDYSTSVAMRLARVLHKSPMEIGEGMKEEIAKQFPAASSIEVVKPGFINFRLNHSSFSSAINSIIDAGDDYGKNDSGKGDRVLVEWVSANPTGDLHCGKPKTDINGISGRVNFCIKP